MFKQKDWVPFIYKNKGLLLSIILVPVIGIALWQGWIFYDQKQVAQIEKEIYSIKSALVTVEEKSGGSFFQPNDKFKRVKLGQFSEIEHVLKKYMDYFMSQTYIRSSHLTYSIELVHLLMTYKKQNMIVPFMSSLYSKKLEKKLSYYLFSIQFSGSLIDQKMYDKAIEVLNKIKDKKDVQPFYVDIMLKLALCYTQKKNFIIAKGIYASLKKKKDLSGIEKVRLLNRYNLLLLQEKKNAS